MKQMIIIHNEFGYLYGMIWKGKEIIYGKEVNSKASLAKS